MERDKQSSPVYFGPQMQNTSSGPYHSLLLLTTETRYHVSSYLSNQWKNFRDSFWVQQPTTPPSTVSEALNRDLEKRGGRLPLEQLELSPKYHPEKLDKATPVPDPGKATSVPDPGKATPVPDPGKATPVHSGPNNGMNQSENSLKKGINQSEVSLHSGTKNGMDQSENGLIKGMDQSEDSLKFSYFDDDSNPNFSLLDLPPSMLYFPIRIGPPIYPNLRPIVVRNNIASQMVNETYNEFKLGVEYSKQKMIPPIKAEEVESHLPILCKNRHQHAGDHKARKCTFDVAHGRFCSRCYTSCPICIAETCV